MENNKCEHCAKHKHRTEKEYKSLVNRLNRIEGQIRGIKGMLEKRRLLSRYSGTGCRRQCGTQRFNKELLADHIRTCVADDIRAGNDETIDELVGVLQKAYEVGETMTQYNVTGMSCAACVARVEKAVSKIDGVNSCSVSLLTNSMNVDGSADSSAIIKAVQNAGYGASLKGKEKKIARSRGFSQRYRNTQNQKKDLSHRSLSLQC